MNHIYKVIWNKAKHCYTVVSEIAKSHSQSNKRARSMTAVVAAAMMLTGFGGMAIEAANPASGDTNITIGKGASSSIWNGVTGHDGFTSGYISIGENAFTWDGEHTYKDKYARIGTKEYLLDFNQGAVGGAESFLGIPYKYRVTDGTKLAGAIAIGKNTMARTGSVMIGDHTYKGQLGDIEVDPSNKQTLNNGIYSTTLGTSSYNSGSMATVTGAFSIASGNKYTNDTQNFGATIYGSLNSIESSTTSDSASGMANSVLGFGNRTQNANASLVWGTGNEVTNSIEDVTFSTNWNKTSASDAQKEIIKAMQSDQFAGGSVMAIGGGNKADWATYSQLLGVKNTLIGENGAVSKYDMINGYKNKVTNATNTSIIGSNNTATNIQSTIVMGDHNTATNIQSTIVMGDHNTLEGRKNVISLGNKNTVVVDDAVAIGNGTTVKAESGVAIGEGSVADRVAGSEKGALGAFAPANIPTGEESTWTSTKGAVSVGDTANNITRQITNVAAGREDTDAVNVAQLKQVNSKADSATEMANKGWNLTTGVVTDATQVKPGDTVDFSGDKNISVSHKGTDVSIALKDTLTLGSNATDGYVTVDGVKGTVWAGHAVSAGNVNMDGDSGEITGLTNTTLNSKDFATTGRAATEEQLKLVKNQADSAATEASKHSKVVNGSNITVEETDQDGQKTYQVKLNENIDVNSVQTNALNSKYNLSVGTMAENGIMPFFVNSTGAFYAAHNKFSVDKDGNVNANSVQTNALNSKYNLSVGTANENGIMPFFVNSTGDFYAAHNKFHVDKDGKVTATAGEIGNVVLQNGVYYGHSTLQDGSLLLTDDNGNHSYIDAKGAKLGKVTVAEDGKITGVAAGAITADSTDAVNGSQLHAVATEAGKHSKVVNGSNISVEETDVDGQKIYKVGLNDDILLGKLTGNNVSISGTNGTIETTGYIATKDRIIADKGAQLADITVSGNAISNGEAKVALDGAAGTAGMINGKGASLYMQDGTTVINNKVGIDQEGKITGVAAGKISADSTDAVNGSQLHEVATEAGKHSKVVNGSNITVEETDQDGQKTYKVGLNKDILLGDITGKNVSISGTMGTIETTGYIATKDRIIADKGAQLADITVSGNAISNGEAKVALDGAAGTAGMINGKGASLYMQDGTTVINNKVGIDQEGKITGVAAGEISATSKDAVNGSQLKQTNDKVDALDKRVTQNEADIAQNKADIAQNKAGIAQNKKDINKLDTRVTNVEELAKKHTTVAAGDNITVTEGTNKDGGKNYTVAMKKDITVDSVKAGDTTINTEGVRIGDTTSLKKDSLTIGGKTYVTDKGLNANDQKVTGVAAGEISSTSTDAVNGSQLFKTNQQVNKLGNRINKVGAGAAALAALHPLDFDPDDKWDFAAGYGNYNGENAAAIGAYYRPNEDTMFSVGGSFGNGENMVNAGVSLKLGQGNHVSTSKVAMAKEIKDLRKELEGLKSALLDVNAGKKLDTSKLQLFPDVPKNHWAYEYVSALKGNGMLTGYPDGEFKGDRPMTRYEFATMLYKAMLEGATLSDKILKEFAPELEHFTVDTVHQDKDGKPTVERVRTVKAEK